MSCTLPPPPPPPPPPHQLPKQNTKEKKKLTVTSLTVLSSFIYHGGGGHCSVRHWLPLPPDALLLGLHNHVAWVEFVYLVFTGMARESYHSRLRSFSLCFHDVCTWNAQDVLHLSTLSTAACFTASVLHRSMTPTSQIPSQIYFLWNQSGFTEIRISSTG